MFLMNMEMVVDVLYGCRYNRITRMYNVHLKYVYLSKMKLRNKYSEITFLDCRKFYMIS